MRRVHNGLLGADGGDPMTTHRVVIDIKIEDDETGEPTIIPVELTYVVEKDQSYGADADGRRGVTREEVYVWDQAIPYEHMKHLTLAQVEYVLDRAIKTVTEGVRS
jgi:hypothetical protein